MRLGTPPPTRMLFVMNFLEKSKACNEKVFAGSIYTSTTLHFIKLRIFAMFKILLQKQPFGGVLRKRYSENMQQIYRRTPMPK